MADKSRFVRVWGRIELRRLEDQRLQMVRKEQGLVHVAAQGRPQGSKEIQMTYHQQDLRSTWDAKGCSPSAGQFAALDTYLFGAAAAPLSNHNHTHSSYQSDCYTPYWIVRTRVEKHEKRELLVSSPKHRHENVANGRIQHQ
jgi:hypothetical protein